MLTAINKYLPTYLSFLLWQIHGYRFPEIKEESSLFGCDPKDTDFNTKRHPITVKEENEDVTLAVCKIDLQPLATGSNGLIRGDFSLEGPTVSLAPLGREALCTNDFNATKSNLVPELVVQPYILLESSMFLEVSIGLVGCKPRDMIKSFSRFFCIIKESDYVMTLLAKITDINEYLIACEKKDDLLTGFALDTGNEVFVYLEGPRDAQILHVWELTEDFYPSVRPLFSTSSRYGTRIYPGRCNLFIDRGAIIRIFVSEILDNNFSYPSTFCQFCFFYEYFFSRFQTWLHWWK